MRLWTIQPSEIYEQIKNFGYYCCDENNPQVAFGHDFDKAYGWLVKQMKERIGDPPKGVKYPVWAWHTRNGKHKKPDLRYAGYAKRGALCVLMEIEIPDDQVVLSDFNAWHYVLNDWFYDDSTSEKEWNEKHAWFDSLPDKMQVTVKERSWLNVFNISPFNNEWAIRGAYVQATFWRLKAEQIVSHHFFTAK